MLKRITRDEVRLGMYIHSLEGRWLDHPFWRRRFCLTDPRDLLKLQQSNLVAILIDDELGIGIESPPAPLPRAESPPRAVVPLPDEKVVREIAGSAESAARPIDLSLTPCSYEEEISRASKVVKRSKTTLMRMFGDVRMGKAVETPRLMMLVEDISASISRNASTLINVVRLKTKDEYTYLHSVAVSALMINLARALDLDEALIPSIGLAGLLHDAGKISVSAAILNKPGRLTDEEVSIVRTHPLLGRDLLARSANVPEVAHDVCLHHHEKMDGTGYPFGLNGGELSIYARMAAVCDVYDAVTSHRAYKQAWSPQRALTEMSGWKGHFDPVVLAAFIGSIGIYPIGALVRLRSEHLGIVIGENAADPLRPIVRSFYSIAGRHSVPHEDVAVGSASILTPEKPDDWGIDDWPALSASLLGSISRHGGMLSSG